MPNGLQSRGPLRRQNGTLFRRHRQLGRLVALKTLHPDMAADPERQRRLLLEAKAASALNDPHIVALYDMGSADGIDFLVMEYVPGETLNKVIARGGLATSRRKIRNCDERCVTGCEGRSECLLSFWDGMEGSLGGMLGESGGWLKVIPEVERFGIRLSVGSPSGSRCESHCRRSLRARPIALCRRVLCIGIGPTHAGFSEH